MITFINRFYNELKRFFAKPAHLFRSQAIETMEAECIELEHIFTLLTTGTVVGIPASPLPLTFALLPHMEDNIISLLSKTDTAGFPLSYLFSVLKVN